MTSPYSGGTQAVDWFENEAEFKQLCLDAKSLARSEAAQEFTHQMLLKAISHGLQTFVSVRQMAYLCDLADWEVPNRRSF